MNRRFFWQMPEGIKFRTVFENAGTIVGVNERSEHRLFRKDTSVITFNRREVSENSLISPVKKTRKAITRKRGKKSRAAYV